MVAIQVNCAAIFAIKQSSTLVKSYNSSEEQIHVVSFKRTKANHDKLPRLNTERSYKRQGHATLKHFVGFFVQWWKAEITVA